MLDALGRLAVRVHFQTNHHARVDMKVDQSWHQIPSAEVDDRGASLFEICSNALDPSVADEHVDFRLD
jgi:hypothetical protein